MTREELIKLRNDLLHHNSEQLKEIYKANKQDCVRLLVAKMHISVEKAEDVFTDALLVFRQNVISEHIKELSSVRAYLNSTCINMVRESWNYDKRRKKKEDSVRLLFYQNNHITEEESIRKEELLELSNKAFLNLNRKCQDILVAFYVYRIPMKEIAEEYGFASSDVAKMTKSRCYKVWMKEVKKLLNKDYDK